jgi:IS30 family transposase
MHVSHVTMYAHPLGVLRRHLIASLRHDRSTRMPRERCMNRRGPIPERANIHVRLPES